LGEGFEGDIDGGEFADTLIGVTDEAGLGEDCHQCVGGSGEGTAGVIGEAGLHPFGGGHNIGAADPFAHIGEKEGTHENTPHPVVPHRPHSEDE